ncbi:MAG: aminotransferase class I/II-fold pyridoxal phosphate-dependent enzyme [Xanthomonadales bacterium]|nr:aminotransferase class I/II-fold pyridoxal phosphate-dependent enzyme [Xanthomonadales bacterium]
MKFEKYATEFVQEIGSKQGAISPPITQSAAFAYGDSATGEGIFDGSVQKPLYSRMGNPTTAKLEGMLARMDGGIGAVCTSSGMGAVALSCMSIVSAGDEIISIGGLFGGTYALFDETLSRFGVNTTFFDVDELEAIEAAITPQTKIVYLESVGNPNMRLPDIRAIADIATCHGVALIIDNTVTPMSLRPLELGADICVYSTTKIISGNAAVLGGAAVFRAINMESEDKFRTDRYADIHKFIDKMGAMALIPNAKKRALRDFGMSTTAFSSYLTLLGMETLPLRMQRVIDSVEKVAIGLADAGFNINHPCLPEHPHHQRYKDDFSAGCGSLLTIDMGSREQAFSLLDNSKLVFITANLGDSRTLALHMGSTIYSDFTDEQREFLGITPGLIRVSIGLENPEDVIADFIRARD